MLDTDKLNLRRNRLNKQSDAYSSTGLYLPPMKLSFAVLRESGGGVLHPLPTVVEYRYIQFRCCLLSDRSKSEFSYHFAQHQPPPLAICAQLLPNLEARQQFQTKLITQRIQIPTA